MNVGERLMIMTVVIERGISSSNKHSGGSGDGICGA